MGTGTKNKIEPRKTEKGAPQNKKLLYVLDIIIQTKLWPTEWRNIFYQLHTQ